MNAEDELRRWYAAEQKNVLVDIRVFHGRSSVAMVRDVTAEVMIVARGDVECKDVTDQTP